MKKQTIFALAIAAVIVVASADPAMAYVLLSPRRAWASTPGNVPVYSPATARSPTAAAA